jgi:hypothetical protein
MLKWRYKALPILHDKIQNLEHDPNLTLSPKILIYYIEEARPNPLERSSFLGTPLT